VGGIERAFNGGGRLVLVWRALWLALLVPCTAAAADDAGRTTIAVFGDSQAQGIAGGLQRVTIEDSRFRIVNHTHPGAALVHGENEWFGPIRAFVGHEKADVAVVMFGANDRLDIPAGDGGGYVRFRSDAWRDVYGKRVGKVMSALTDAGLKVIWCGNPIARSDTYSNDMSYINEIFAEQAAQYGVQFFPLWGVIVDDQGRYAAHGKDRDGVTRRMRADDGIHFTAPGYEVIADRLIGALPVADAHAAKAP